jgi:hypothetical protein
MQAASFDKQSSHHRRQSIEDARRRLEALARLLDSAVRVPGTGIRFGADAVLNFIPGIGTVAAKVLAAYLIWEARRLGVPPAKLARMVGHVGLDLAISLVPVVGWFGDAFYRANLKNMTLLREHLDNEGRVLDLKPDRVTTGATA